MKKATKDNIYMILNVSLISTFVLSMSTLVEAIDTVNGFIVNIGALLLLILVNLTRKEKK